MIIIFGTRTRKVDQDSGQFYCPHCETLRSYKRQHLGNYFTLFFIPVFRIKELGEQVECQVCKHSFDPKVLNYQPPSPADRLLSAAQADLKSGTPIEMVQRKLVNSGVNQTTAKKVVDTATGSKRMYCQRCGLSYQENINLCSNCGNRLSSSM